MVMPLEVRRAEPRTEPPRILRVKVGTLLFQCRVCLIRGEEKVSIINVWDVHTKKNQRSIPGSVLSRAYAEAYAVLRRKAHEGALSA